MIRLLVLTVLLTSCGLGSHTVDKVQVNCKVREPVLQICQEWEYEFACVVLEPIFVSNRVIGYYKTSQEATEACGFNKEQK